MNQRTYHKPPVLAAALLGWLLKDEWHTPLGDFEEYFNELVHERGLFWARWWYRGQVARLLPDRLYEKTYWKVIMIKSYFLLAYRNLLKNRVASVINIFGLSVALACSIVVYLFLQGYLNLGGAHENGERIFIVEHTVQQDGELQTWGTSPMPLGPAMEAEFPQVERAVRIDNGGAFVQNEDKTFEEWIVFADEGYFDVFTFPLQYGTHAALSDPNAVIISEQMAIKYFGKTDVLGEELTFSFGNDRTELLTIGGVAEAFPGNSGMYFNFLLNFDKQRDVEGEDIDDWGALANGTFLLLERREDIDGLADQMERYIALQNAANEDWTILSFRFENFIDPAPDAFLVRRRPAEASHPGFIMMMLAIPLAMLALSCFNYVNISLGSTSRRLREIGVRKVMGGTKVQLIAQFMAENLLLCFLSLVIGLGIAVAFLVPLFNSHFHANQITLSLADNVGLWVFMVGLLAFVGFASGAYPAFYVSSFQPVVIFRGKQKLGRKKWFTRSFLTFQFVLAFMTVIIGVYLSMNGQYMLNQDWGYNAEQTLVVRISNSQQYTLLRDEMLKHPNVIEVAGSASHIGTSFGRLAVEIDGEDRTVQVYSVGPRYFEVMGLNLASGRFFEEDISSGGAQGIVINKAFAKAEEWDEPLGQMLRIGGEDYPVVGVVEDFLANPVFKDWPFTFLQTTENQYQYLSVRVEAGASTQTAAALEDTWERLFPNAPLSFFFQDEVFDTSYESYAGIVQSFSYIAALALLISCMGLFGLASQNISRRLKEVSIRKVLGASDGHITFLVNRGFLTMILVAGVLASLIFYGAVTAVVASFDAETLVMPMRLSLFGIAFTLVFLTAAISVASQARKLISANPAEVLRNE